MHFIFWQNILSPHQAAFMRALADLGHQVIVIAGEAMTESRLALGWKVPELGRARVVINPSDDEVKQLIDSTSREAIHILAGARWTKLGRLATQLCLSSRQRLGVLSEAPDPRGIPGYGRWAKYTIERYVRGGHYDFVLAMGEIGVQWFRSCGYPSRRVLPFAYVTEITNCSDEINSKRDPIFLYAGQFIVRKGLDVLLRAYAALPAKRANLHLLGDGPEKEQIKSLGRDLRIHDRIVWLDKRNTEGVQLEMTKSDVTLLPSRHDGWGAVINESIMAGTPVICSTACGASELVRQPWLGSVFRSESVEALTKVLRYWIDQGPRKPAERERIRNWANCITGQSIAEYFAAIMEHIYCHSPRPIAPWRMR